MKTFIVWLVCLIILVHGIRGCYLENKKWDNARNWNDIERPIDRILLDGQEWSVRGVKVVKIPQTVYDNMSKTTQCSEHLTGDKKRVINPYFGWDLRNVKTSLQQAFEDDKEIRDAYVLDLGGGPSQIYTETPVNATEDELRKAVQTACYWMWDHCLANACIVNPATHEAIIDSSQDPNQILPLLAAYVDWNTEPLLK